MRNDLPVYLIIMLVCGIFLGVLAVKDYKDIQDVEGLLASIHGAGYFTDMQGELMSIDLDQMAKRIIEVKIAGKPKKVKPKGEKGPKVDLKGPIDINKCAASDFEKIPGIGKVVAERIVARRTESGGKFKKVSDLVDVKGISMKKLVPVQKWLTIEGAPVEVLEVKASLKKSASNIALENPVNLNTADIDGLQMLPGIGKKKAESIIAKRNEIGGFKVIEDLALVKGISEDKVMKMKQWICVSDPDRTGAKKVKTGSESEVKPGAGEKKPESKPAQPVAETAVPSGHGIDRPLNINTADIESLQRLPGIGQKKAELILEKRKEIGGFKTIEDLAQVKGISADKVTKMKTLICVSDGVDPEVKSFQEKTAGEQKNTAEPGGEPEKKAEKPAASPEGESVKKETEPVQEVKDNDAAAKIDINSATLEELTTVPGIGPATAQNIIEYRKVNRFSKIEDLMNVKRIGEKSFLKIKDKIKVSE